MPKLGQWQSVGAILDRRENERGAEEDGESEEERGERVRLEGSGEQNRAALLQLGFYFYTWLVAATPVHTGTHSHGHACTNTQP